MPLSINKIKAIIHCIHKGMIMNLKNKKVLMFAPRFFDYENKIKAEIEKQGAIVHLYDERNTPSSIEKILYRKAPVLLTERTNHFYQNVCETEVKFSPDYILFVNPETVNRQSIELIRRSFPNSKLLLYMWDSCKNKKVKHLFPWFDKSFSFDKNDCSKYGLQFRPLFYVSEFSEKPTENVSEGKSESGQYAVSFVGTIHSDRAKILSNIKAFCDQNNLPYYMYLYVPGSLLLCLRKIIDKYLRNFDKAYVHTRPIAKGVVASVLSNSNYIIDINHPKQTGLTMRTIETVGIKRKIVTTNTEVKEYDFYNPVNQVVIDRNKVKLPLESMGTPYVDIPEEIYRKYSLHSWVQDIFTLSKEGTKL